MGPGVGRHRSRDQPGVRHRANWHQASVHESAPRQLPQGTPAHVGVGAVFQVIDQVQQDDRVAVVAPDLEDPLHSELGYREVGRVGTGDGASLTMLKFPGEQVVTLELVHRPADGPVQVGTGFSHLVVQVDELAATLEALSERGLRPGRTVLGEMQQNRKAFFRG